MSLPTDIVELDEHHVDHHNEAHGDINSLLAHVGSVGATDESTLDFICKLALSGKPLVNIKAPKYGAVGDGSTDDTADINSALGDVKATGGIVLLPPSTTAYKTLTAIDLTDHIHGTIIMGSGKADSAWSTASTIRYASNSGTAMHLFKASGVKLVGIRVEYSSLTYTGDLVYLEGGGPGVFDTNYFAAEDCYFGGQTSSHRTANSAVNVKYTINSSFRNCTFNRAVVCLRLGGAASPSNGYANIVLLDRCWLANGTTSSIYSHAHQSLNVVSCTFEGGTVTGLVANAYAQDSANSPNVTKFDSCWFGDVTSGTWLASVKSKVFYFVGNYMGGGGSTNGLTISGAQGVNIVGNDIDVSGTAIDFTGATQGVVIMGNDCGSTTNLAGTSNIGTSGIIWGNRGTGLGNQMFPKPSITGSRGGNAALASLLTAMNGIYITDNTTA